MASCLVSLRNKGEVFFPLDLLPKLFQALKSNCKERKEVTNK